MMALSHSEGRDALLGAREAGWLSVVTIANSALPSSLRLTGLDEGESEAIALAVESSARLLLIDEKKGRRAARRLDVPVTGALGILAKGRRMGDVDSVRREIGRLRLEAGFFISDQVQASILELAGEG
jgi:predicted nucleic acid-binding protein